MIKGFQKNAIIIKDTGSEIFEQAIFIVKKEIPALSDYTLMREAERIIEEKVPCARKRNKRSVRGPR